MNFTATISTQLELETRGWYQIQGEKNIFLDHTYFVKIDSLEVEIYCKLAKRVRNEKVSQQPFLRLPSFNHHF